MGVSGGWLVYFQLNKKGRMSGGGTDFLFFTKLLVKFSIMP